MPQFKVLVPLDGSEYAERALTILPSLVGLGSLYVRLKGLSMPRSWKHCLAPRSGSPRRNVLCSHLEMKQKWLESEDMLVGWEVH
jgi:hypothetical protein